MFFYEKLKNIKNVFIIYGPDVNKHGAASRCGVSSWYLATES